MAEKNLINVSRKEMVMVGLFAVLLGLYVGYGTSCFRIHPMHIEHSVRPSVRMASVSMPAGKPRIVYVTSFAFDREYKFTSIKVFRVQDLPDNNKILPLWHLEGKAAATRSLVYGSTPQGMAPFVAGTEAQPLEADVSYRIFIEAGSLRGEHDFTITGQAAAAAR